MKQLKGVSSLDRNSPLPLHYQIREIIRHEALSGELVDESGKIATESELVERFQVSRITVKNAIKSLVDEGLFYRERGRGTFIRKSINIENRLGRLLGFSEMIRSLGLQPSTKLLHKGMTKAIPQKVKDKLLIQEAWEYRRLRYADNLPIGIEHSYLPTQYGNILENQDDLDTNYGFEYMESKLGIHIKDGEQMISAVNANHEQAELLRINEGSSLLFIERVTYSVQAKPIVFLKALYNPKYFQYYVTLSR